MGNSTTKTFLQTAAGIFLVTIFLSNAMGQTASKNAFCFRCVEIFDGLDEPPRESDVLINRDQILDLDNADKLSLEMAAAEIAGKPSLQRSSYRTAGPNRSSTSADEQTTPEPPASNGSSPVDLITRVEMKYQFQNFGSGYLHGVPIIRGDYAFSKAVGFRIDLPILHFHSRVPGQPNQSGIGDIVTSMTFVKLVSKRFVLGVVPRIDFPTASGSALGSGKYSFKPTAAGLTPLGKGLAFATALEYRVSFAGKSNRSDIHELSIKPLFFKSFLAGSLKGFYANPQLEVIVDFENNNRTTWQAAVHMGKVLSKNVVLFWIPTFHVGGTKRDSFKFEAGFRYLFR